MSDADVVIAGAGPSGLMLACELALQGVRRTIVLDPLSGPNQDPRANGVGGPAVRLLDHRGFYEQLTGSSAAPQPLPTWMFGALSLDVSVVHCSQNFLMPVQQPVLTQALAERAGELGVDLRWGQRLIGVNAHRDGVAVEVEGPAGQYRLEADYLVGADGGRGATRKLAGINFVGMSSRDAVFRIGRGLAPPPEWRDEETGQLRIPGVESTQAFPFVRGNAGMLFCLGSADLNIIGTLELAPAPDDTYIAGQEHPGFGEPLTLSELRESVRRVLDVDMPLQPAHSQAQVDLRRYAGINTLIADRYRKDRVLLVGDAAHVQSPIGGPGLNLGLQDAANLGWKLAAVVRGDAQPELLDSFDTERRIAAECAIMTSRAQFALLRPGPEVTALRQVVGELATQPRVAERLAEMMFLTAVRYPADPGDHPAVGHWVPDLAITTANNGGARVAQLARDGRPLLLDFTTGSVIADALASTTAAINIVSGTPTQPVDLTAVLVRPDGYVAWATSAPVPDLSGLGRALRRWFGVVPPLPSAANSESQRSA